MRWPKIVVVATALAAAGLGPRGAAQSAETSLGGEVRRLVELGSQRTKDARDAARQQYDRLRKLAPRDPRIQYAYALVQLQQMRYRDALDLLREATGANLPPAEQAGAPRLPDARMELAAWKALVWVEVVVDNDRYPADAMTRVAQLAAAADSGQRQATEATTEPDQGQTEEPAGFLGRVHGYLAGPAMDPNPAAKAAQEPLLARSKARVLAPLTTIERTAFEQAARRVVDAFGQATRETEADAARAEAAAAAERDRKLRELDQRQQVAGSAAADEQARLDERRKKTEYELEKMAKEEQETVGRARVMQVDAGRLQSELRVLDSRIAETLAAAEKEEDALRKQALLNDAARWQFQRSRALAELTNRQQVLAALNQQGIALQRRRQTIQGQLAQDAGRVDQLRQNVERLARQRTVMEKKPVDGSTAGVLDQRRRSTALTTYVPLPLVPEEEAKRLLESFK